MAVVVQSLDENGQAVAEENVAMHSSGEEKVMGGCPQRIWIMAISVQCILEDSMRETACTRGGRK